MSHGLTRVTVLFLRDRVNDRVRFGKPTSERIIDRRCKLDLFAPGAVFSYVQWRANPYGTEHWRLWVLQAAKRDYYVQSRLGNRLFDLGLGPVALAFVAAGTPRDHAAIDRVLAEHGAAGFAGAWLAGRGLDWAADLARRFDLLMETAP